MKNHIIYILVFIFACGNKYEKQTSRAESATVSSTAPTIDSIHFVDIGKTNILGFKTISDTSKYPHIKSISVYSDENLIQEIYVDKSVEDKQIKFIDWNFDGYKDLTLTWNCGSGGCAYYIWNYLPLTNSYEYNNKLSEVLGLEIDSIDERVMFNYRMN